MEVAVGRAVGDEVGAVVGAFVGDGSLVGVGVKVCFAAGLAGTDVDEGWSTSGTALQDIRNRTRISRRDSP